MTFIQSSDLKQKESETFMTRELRLKFVDVSDSDGSTAPTYI